MGQIKKPSGVTVEISIPVYPSVNAIKEIISSFQRPGAVCDLPRSERTHTERNVKIGEN